MSVSVVLRDVNEGNVVVIVVVFVVAAVAVVVVIDGEDDDDVEDGVDGIGVNGDDFCVIFVFGANVVDRCK